MVTYAVAPDQVMSEARQLAYELADLGDSMEQAARPRRPPSFADKIGRSRG